MSWRYQASQPITSLHSKTFALANARPREHQQLVSFNAVEHSVIVIGAGFETRRVRSG
jgi:hypothetical protein